MRMSKEDADFKVRAIAGTHVVLLAIKPKDRAKLREDFRGFSISRTDDKGHMIWLEGIKYFDGTVQNWSKGMKFSSLNQPIQTLFWSDYGAAPKNKYTFSIIPNYGDVANLEKGAPINIDISTEDQEDDKHEVWFNRGVIATNQHAVQFQNSKLTEEMANNVSEEGVLNDRLAAWLSRGLAEACLKYINGTKPGEGLRACLYEFTWLPVLGALKRAHERGVDVQMIYHSTIKKGDHAGEDGDNEIAIAAAKLPKKILKARTRPPIPHNKFIVKLEGHIPKQVWTGSTNITDSGFMGQTNVGHLVKDEDVAKIYLKYWTELHNDPTGAPATTHAMALSPNPPNVVKKDSIVPFFSPRRGDNMLDWYGARIKNACSLALITLPFNVAPQILDGLKNSKALRLAILEESVDEFPDLAAAERDSHGMLAISSGAILGKTFVHHKKYGGATVAPISTGKLDDWFIEQELARKTNTGHVFFVHSKIILVDPLSEDPLVCTGSANFSHGSLVTNDENMLLIRGNKRVADIYLTELDRIFKHFYDRDAMNRSAEKGEGRDLIHLDTTNGWLESNFKTGSYKMNRLMIFFPDTQPSIGWADMAAKDKDLFADEEERHQSKRKGGEDGDGD